MIFEDVILLGYYDPIILGERIREARKKAGLTQAQFARALNMSEESLKTIGRWEKGEQTPKLDILMKMCEIFECEAGYLLGEFSLPTREKTDIQEATGLSQEAIDTLLEMKQVDPNIFPYADQIISHCDFYMMALGLASSMRYMRSHPDTICEDTSELVREISQKGFAVLIPEDAALYWLQQTFDTWKRIVNSIWRKEYEPTQRGAGRRHNAEENSHPQRERVHLLGGQDHHGAGSGYWVTGPAVFHWEDTEGSPREDAGCCRSPQ